MRRSLPDILPEEDIDMTNPKASRRKNWDALNLPDTEEKKWKPKEFPRGDHGINLTKVAMKVLQRSVKQVDENAFEAASTVLIGLMVLQKLWAAFQECENIDGPNGVAALLGVSRSRVYQRINEFGLTQDLLNDPNTTEQSLALKSPKLVAALRALKKFDVG